MRRGGGGGKNVHRGNNAVEDLARARGVIVRLIAGLLGRSRSARLLLVVD